MCDIRENTRFWIHRVTLTFSAMAIYKELGITRKYPFKNKFKHKEVRVLTPTDSKHKGPSREKREEKLIGNIFVEGCHKSVF